MQVGGFPRTQGPAQPHDGPLGRVLVAKDHVAGAVIYPLHAQGSIAVKVLQHLLGAHLVYAIQMDGIRPPCDRSAVLFPLLQKICTRQLP